MSNKSKKFNFKEEKEKMMMPDAVKLEVHLPKDVAIGFNKFVETFRPHIAHPNLGKNEPISMNDFLVLLLLEGAESIQQKFMAAAKEQAETVTQQQPQDEDDGN